MNDRHLDLSFEISDLKSTCWIYESTLKFLI